MTPKNMILIAEDNDDDFEAAEAALSGHASLANRFVRVESGDEALDYLYGRGAHHGDKAPERPALILLDLNLPGTDGRDVLRTIKQDEDLKSIPVVVMTTSGEDVDIDSCYRDGANSYVVKPLDISGFFEALSRLRDYWFEIVVLPK